MSDDVEVLKRTIEDLQKRLIRASERERTLFFKWNMAKLKIEEMEEEG